MKSTVGKRPIVKDPQFVCVARLKEVENVMAICSGESVGFCGFASAASQTEIALEDSARHKEPCLGQFCGVPVWNYS